MALSGGSATPLNTPLASSKGVRGDEILTQEWHVGDLILGTYEVREVFTTGGMALVYRVYHRGWGIELAVKSIRQEMLNIPDCAESFTREAETWVNLGLYPHLIACYYVRLLGGIPRIFMEYANGGSLEDGIEQGWLYTGAPGDVLKRMLDIAIQFAWGLHYAHEKGVIHQDVKPGNLLMCSDGLAKVTDLGIAQAMARLAERKVAPINLEDHQDGRKSILVDTLGMTPLYCSPEQSAGNPLSRRTDIYSWAVSVLEMFMGGKAWTNGTAAGDALEKYLFSGPSLSSIPMMPYDLSVLMRECLAHDPDARPHDMAVVSSRLKAIYESESGEPYPREEPKIDTILLADALNNRAISMIDLDRDHEALHYFDEALKAEINHTTARYNRNLYEWRSGHLTDQEVLQILKDTASRRPGDWEPAYFSGLIHMERGDSPAAARIAQKLIEQYGETAPLRNLLQLARREYRSEDGCLQVIKSTQGPANSVAISGDGSRFLSGGNDGVLRLWDSETGQCLLEMAGHSQIIRAVGFNFPGTQAVSGSWDETIKVWDLSSGACLKTLVGHSDIVQDVLITPDGNRALSASGDCSLRLWDLPSGECYQELVGHTDTVSAAAICPDGITAISASYDGTLRLWDLLSGRCLKVIQWSRGCTSNLSLTPDGRFVALGSGDNRIWLIELSTGQAVQSFVGHTGTINTLQLALGGARMLTGGQDGTVRLWDANTGRCLRTFSGHPSPVTSVAINLPKALAVSAGTDQTIRLWSLWPGPKAPYVTVQPHSAREVEAITTQIESDLKKAEELLASQDAPAALQLLSQLRSDPKSRHNPRLLKLWDQAGLHAIRSGLADCWLVNSFMTHMHAVNAIAWASDGKSVLSGSDDQTICLWDMQSQDCSRRLLGHVGAVTSLALMPGNRFALSGSADATLRVWRIETEECIAVLNGHTSQVNSVALSPEALYAVSSSNDQTVRVWDLARNRLFRTLKGHSHYVKTALFSPDGRRVISAGWDKTLRIWDVITAETLQVLTGPEEIIETLAVSPDGQKVVTAGNATSIHIWDLEGGYVARVLEAQNRGITSLCFSPDGLTLFTGGADGSLAAWEVASGRCMLTMFAHTQPISAIAISLDSLSLLTTSADRLVKAWRLDWEYALPETWETDGRFMAYLAAFLARRNPTLDLNPGHNGHSPLSPPELDALMQELAYRGYGGLPRSDVLAALKTLPRQ